MIAKLTRMTSLISATLALSAQIAAAQDWSGSYGGLLLGYGDGMSNHINGTAERDAPAISGATYGVTLGQNFAALTGDFVYGVEFDAARLGLEGEVPSGSGFGCALTVCRTKVSWLATLRGRVGIARA